MRSRSLGIIEGDIIICDQDTERRPVNGDIIVIRVESDLTLKIWHRIDDRIELRDGDDNVKHELSLMDDYTIEGY